MHGWISHSQRATNAWHSTTKHLDYLDMHHPHTQMNKSTYLIQEYHYLHMGIYYIALPTVTIKTHTISLSPNEESTLIVLVGWEQAAECGQGVLSMTEKLTQKFIIANLLPMASTKR